MLMVLTWVNLQNAFRMIRQYEKFLSHPATWVIKVFKTKFATIGILICWDRWYPEASRITALMGAEVLFITYRYRLGCLTG